RQDPRSELKLVLLQQQEILLVAPQQFLNSGPLLEGAAPSRNEGRGARRSSAFSGVVRGFPALSRTTLEGPGEDGEWQGTGGPNLDQYNQAASYQSEPSLLAIMQQMTQIMANLHAA
ncbi:hypothetical protein O181_064479, partial [Austropuccinia psidii MF-1]|nr:hypothetical protein [Austropuccinia psidii MF-1]